MPQVALLGQVNSVRGCHASVGLTGATPNGPEETRATVGKFLGVCANKSLLIGLITDVSLQPGPTPQDQPVATAQLELIGEISNYDSASARFQRGVTTYPAIGDTVTFIAARELRLIFHSSSSRMIDIGHLQLDAAIAARLDVDEMVSKHFAVLGTTGVGKSSAVALLLQQIVEARPDLRFFVLDVHNEYSRCFGDRSQVLNPSNLKLPFWLFNFDEIVDVFFGGRPSLDEEIDFLSEVIPLAKSLYAQQFSAQGRLSPKSGEVGARYTLDIPVPYRIADLITLLDSRMGKLENRSSRMIYHKLITRIESVCGDPRYAFMFENANVGGDTMAEILATLFRLPPNGKPMTIMQLAGFPSEVVDAVVSVTCRMAFDLGLWSDGTNPVLLVCEEAHRYMAADHNIGFAPTRRAISRIAKEGRKYGVFLGLVTQRPAELDPTHPVAMQHAVCDAHDQRARSIAAAFGGRRYRGQSAGVPAVARHRRSLGLRRRRGAADAAQIQAIARQCVAEERDGESRRSLAGKQQISAFAGVGGRALARPHRRAAEPAKTGRRDGIAVARADGAERQRRSIRTASGCSNGRWISRS